MSEPPCVCTCGADVAAMQVGKFMHRVGFPRLRSFPLYKLNRAIRIAAPVFYYSHPIFVCRAFARSGSRYNIKSVVYCYRVLHCSGHETLTQYAVYTTCYLFAPYTFACFQRCLQKVFIFFLNRATFT